VYVALAAILLWVFYNILLELVKGHQERGSMSVVPAILALAVAIWLGWLGSSGTLIWVIISSFFVGAYLLKKRVRFFGQTNNLVRGFIQAAYLLFAFAFYGTTFTADIWWLAAAVVLVTFARSLVGDIRDVKHDTFANKQTLPVTVGIQMAKILSGFAILATIFIITIVLHITWLVALPLWLFACAIVFYRNGYVLHQLSVVTTSALAVNLIFAFTNHDLIIVNLIYLGIFINMIYYPLLNRKSNPTFIQPH
jgi:4-hydroxybenzoate polyprenyltransferase